MSTTFVLLTYALVLKRRRDNSIPLVSHNKKGSHIAESNIASVSSMLNAAAIFMVTNAFIVNVVVRLVVNEVVIMRVCAYRAHRLLLLYGKPMLFG